MLKHLLEDPRFRISINSRDHTGRTFLSWAAEENTTLVKWFCEQEWIDVNLADEDNQTPLMYAAEYGNEDIVRTLLERDPSSINNKSHKHGDTALALADENGHESVFLLLLNHIETPFGKMPGVIPPHPQGDTPSR